MNKNVITLYNIKKFTDQCFDKDNDKVASIIIGEDKKLGFWLMLLSFPYRGKAIPFNFITYSSKTINDEVTSHNLEHGKVIGELKELLGDKPLVLDREFSMDNVYLIFMRILLGYVRTYV